MPICSRRAASSSSSSRARWASTSSRSRFFSSVAPRRAFNSTGLNGFEQIIDRAELDAAHHAVHLVERRDHDDREIAQPGLILQPGEHLIAVHLRHLHVEQDEVEGFALEPRDRLLAVLRGFDIAVTLEIEVERQRVAIVVVVIDDEDARALSVWSMTGHRALPSEICP